MGQFLFLNALLPAPRHHQGYRLRHLGLIEEPGGDALSPVILDLLQKAHHLRKTVCLIHRAERLQRMDVLLRILPLQPGLIVGRCDVDADAGDGNIFVDQHPVWLHTAQKGFNAPGGQTPVGGQLLPGDGLIVGDGQAGRDIKFQKGVLPEGKIVDLDGEQVLLTVNPVVTVAALSRLPPAQAVGAVAVIVRLRHKAELPQRGRVQFLCSALHSACLLATIGRKTIGKGRKPRPSLEKSCATVYCVRWLVIANQFITVSAKGQCGIKLRSEICETQKRKALCHADGLGGAGPVVYLRRRYYGPPVQSVFHRPLLRLLPGSGRRGGGDVYRRFRAGVGRDYPGSGGGADPDRPVFLPVLPPGGVQHPVQGAVHGHGAYG